MHHPNPTMLYDLDLTELQDLVVRWGFKPRYARDIWKWIYCEGTARSVAMAALDPALRRRIADEVPVYVPRVVARQEAPGGETRKDLLAMEDGEQVEVVLLRYRDRRSACVSTQIGCACNCCFCATGQSGFVRQLSSGEIIAQVMHLQRELATIGERLSNIVLMGMGEPLLNYDNTIAAVRRLVDQGGMAFVQRRVTLSTVGIPEGIRRLAAENLRIKLAVSIHAATDALRGSLVPISRRYPLDGLFSAMRAYAESTGRHVMLEWVMIDGVNDSVGQARALVQRLEGLPAHVNLIRLNKTASYSGRASHPVAIDAFRQVLDRAGVPHTLRQRRGGDIAAGCGQLRSHESDPRG